MKKFLVFSGIVAAALSGCAALDRAATPRLDPLPVRQAPVVTVVKGKIEVSPELLIFTQKEGRQRVEWRIPADLPFEFHRQRGIVIEGEILDDVIKDTKGRPEAVRLRERQDQVVCDSAPGTGGKTFACEFRNERLMTFKYTIRLMPQGGGQPLERDPVGINGANM